MRPPSEPRSGRVLAGVMARVQALGGQIRNTRRAGHTVFLVSLPSPVPLAAPLPAERRA